MAGVGQGMVAGSVLLVCAQALPAAAAAPVFGPAAPIAADAATDSANDTAPRIATDAHGTWVAIWTSARAAGGGLRTDSDVLTARSHDLGVTWSAPVAVNGGAAVDGEFDFAPALATDGQGLWIAVWAATNGLDTDLFTARSTDGGATWSAKQPLHADAANDAANDDHPHIATDGNGTWVVVWDANQRAGNDRDVFVARSTDGGLTWTPPGPIAADAAGDRGTDQRPQIATDGSGLWLAVWSSNDTRGGTKGSDFDILVARSGDGGATWTVPAPVNANAAADRGLDDRPQVATDGAGTWIVVWASDADLEGRLGSDLDILAARSTDGGATWSWPVPVNSDAGGDDAEDGAPALATDGAGTWVAVWESTGSRRGTGISAHSVIVAHSLDGGAHWSAARVLDGDAAGDGRRDLAPQLATAGGVWNVVWSRTGGAFGSDADVVHAAGREHCGDGVVDPGEQCDAGNVSSGDDCTSACELAATPRPPTTPGPGGTVDGTAPATASTAATNTPGAGSSSDAGATLTLSPSATPATAATPTVAASAAPGSDGTGEAAAATPTGGATPGPGGDTPPQETSTPGASASPTQSPAGTGTPTPAAAGSADPSAAATPQPLPTFSGSLAGTARAKAAVACQRAIFKVGARLVGARLGTLGRCAGALYRCVQTKPGDPACLAKVGVRCSSASAAFTRTERRQSAAVTRACSGTVAFADLLAPAGLGYGGTPCGADAATFDDVVACIVGVHECGSAGIFEILQPRAKELLRLPDTNAATLDSVTCLPDHGGEGAALGDPRGRGRILGACATAIVKAGSSFARKQLVRRAKCADRLFTCAQLAPGDRTCLAAARSRCEREAAAAASEERGLAAALARYCSEPLVPYATLRAAPAANLDALGAACASVGVAALDSLADYRQCLLRSGTCRVEALLTAQAPRFVELLAAAGGATADGDCGRR